MVSLSQLNKEQNSVTTSYIVLTGSTSGAVTTNTVDVRWNNKDVYENFTGAATLVGHIQLTGVQKLVKAYITPVYAEKSNISGGRIKSKTAQVLTLASISGASVTASVTDGTTTFEHRLSSTVAWMKTGIGMEIYFGITDSATAVGSTVYNIDPYVLSHKNYR